MTIVKCNECGHQVAKNAFSCPNCGAHDPLKSGEKFLKVFFISIGLVFIALVAFLSVASEKEPQFAASPPPPNESVMAAKQEMKKEEKIIDLYYDPNANIQWHVGVIDDGTKRYGFASYLCEILHEHNLVSQTTFVRIVDISKVNRGEDFRKASLGKVNCATYEQDYP
jgi:hypothetical protein